MAAHLPVIPVIWQTQELSHLSCVSEFKAKLDNRKAHSQKLKVYQQIDEIRSILKCNIQRFGGSGRQEGVMEVNVVKIHNEVMLYKDVKR